MAPARERKPRVGGKPVVPQRVDGDEIEPKVSEPIAKATAPAAVAEADPADEPLEPWFVYQGFRGRPPNHLLPIANAPRELFATRTASASSRRFTMVASSPNACSCNPPAPQVVG